MIGQQFLVRNSAAGTEEQLETSSVVVVAEEGAEGAGLRKG